MIMKNVICFFIGIAFTSVWAQYGKKYPPDHFVVTTKGDTIYGYLKYFSRTRGIHDKITVKVSDTLKLTFTADEIVYFEEGKNQYVSFIPKGQNEHFFIRIWSVGYYELFEWEVPMHLSRSKRKIEYRPLLRRKGETDFIDLHPRKWKKQLADLFSDYPELADDVRKGMYPLDEMGHVIDRYNEFKEDEAEGW